MAKYVEFNTDIERYVHRKMSAIRFGECIQIEVEVSSKEEKEDVNKAIRKSAHYNNLQVRIYWSKQNDYVKVTNEM